MNEQLSKDKALGQVEVEYALGLIGDRMLETRPKSKLEYRPYIKQPIKQGKVNGAYEVDISQYFPDAKENDCAYVSTDLYIDTDAEVLISIEGNARLWLEDTELFACIGNKVVHGSCQHLYDYYNVAVNLRKGYNRLVVKTISSGGRFGFSLCVSVVRYPTLWANDYILHVRPTYPMEELQGEEGFSISKLICNHAALPEIALMEDDKQVSGSYAFPVIESYGNQFDFLKLYPFGNSDKRYAKVSYAYTKYQCDGILSIIAVSKCRVFLNGKTHCILKAGQEIRIDVKAETKVLIKSVYNEENWGFFAKDDTGACLPFVDTERKDSTNWLCIGSFYTPTVGISAILPPEKEVQFEQPYNDGLGGKVFWRFNIKDTYLRPYLTSKFFGQWFYAIMVGLYGLREMGTVLDKQDKLDYFYDSVSMMWRFFAYARYDAVMLDNPPFIARSAWLESLDDSGTMGMCLCDAYAMSGNERILHTAKEVMKGVMKVPRFDDGTFHRDDTMWADDFYMCGMFFIRMGALTGDNQYFDRMLEQVRGFKKRLWMEDEKLFSHILFLDTQKVNRIPWGRGNGWILFSLAEILLYAPQDLALYHEALELFQQFAEGVLTVMDENGMWHQVLNRKDSYLETSCTAMFTLAFARGARMGWLDERFAVAAEKGWSALLENCVDKKGDVYGVCMGSGRSMDVTYYLDIPTHVNDDHGTGVILAAGSEILRLRKN